MAKWLNQTYQKEYHDRATMIVKIVDNFRKSYLQVVIYTLLGTLPDDLLKVLYGKFYEWLPLADNVKFSNVLKFLDMRLYDDK